MLVREERGAASRCASVWSSNVLGGTRPSLTPCARLEIDDVSVLRKIEDRETGPDRDLFAMTERAVR